MVTANMLLSVFFLSGALSACEHNPPVFIDAPKTMEALSGSCLQIPCRFRIKKGEKFDNTSTSVGVWIIRDIRFAMFPRNVIFNSSTEENPYPMRITGDLGEGNCTTLFSSLITDYRETYYFRIENPLFRATAACDPLYINVTDSPPNPRIEISGDVDVKDLKEKQSVTITCSAFTPCPNSPPELTWTLQQNPQNIGEQNTDGTFTTKIQETITLSDTHDGLTISCSAGYPVDEGRDVKTAAGEITLSVSYAPRDTLAIASPSGLVSAGTLVNLTCSSRAKPPISSFTWFRNSTDGAMNVSEGYFYILNVTEGGDYYCVATSDLGNEKSVIRLSIEETETPGEYVQWRLILGGIIGFILLICLSLCVCTVICWRWLKTSHSTHQQSQSPAAGEPKAEGEEGVIHYGEIDFSKRRPEASSASVQDSGQQQDTLYAEVKMSEKTNSFTQPADSPEDLYAQVKKK